MKFCKCRCILVLISVNLAEFLKTCLKTSKKPRIFAPEPGESQVSGHCGENLHIGLAVLVDLMVKLSP